MKILIVDDYATMRRINRTLLSQNGYSYSDLDEADSGAKALQMLRENSYGLVLCDWNMTPMNGLELLKAIRSDTKLANTPFIMTDAENQQERIIEAKQAGVNNYLIKPYNAATLMQKIKSVVG